MEIHLHPLEVKTHDKKTHVCKLKKCNTPVLTPFALKVHDVYIVINRGEGLKEKSPPLIWL